MKFAIRRADTPNDAIYRKRYAHVMKSDFVGIGAADLISSEAKAEDFIRACEDFIVQSTISLIYKTYALIYLRECEIIFLKCPLFSFWVVGL